MTSEEQLTRWVAGESVHLGTPGGEDGECCPDFSCCRPELKQPEDVRRAFAAASNDKREHFLSVFLAAAIGKMQEERGKPFKSIYIAGSKPGDES